MKRILIYSIIGILLISGVIAGIGLSVSPTTEISKDCYALLGTKDINDLKLVYLFEKKGYDYWAIKGDGFSKSFHVNSTLPIIQYENEINQLKIEKIEEWCSEQTKKYDDVNLTIMEKK